VQFPINVCLAGKIIFSVLYRQDLRPARWKGHCFFGQRSEVELVFLDLLRNFESFLPDEARIMRVSNFCANSMPRIVLVP